MAMAAAVILDMSAGLRQRRLWLLQFLAFITLFGLTLLFESLTPTIPKQVMRRLINVFGKMVWMVPVILFLSAWCVFRLWQEFCRPGIYMRHYDSRYPCHWYDPLMLMIIGNAGSAGRKVIPGTDGKYCIKSAGKQEIDGGLMSLTINMTIAMFIIASLAFVFFRAIGQRKQGLYVWR